MPQSAARWGNTNSSTGNLYLDQTSLPLMNPLDVSVLSSVWKQCHATSRSWYCRTLNCNNGSTFHPTLPLSTSTKKSTLWHSHCEKRTYIEEMRTLVRLRKKTICQMTTIVPRHLWQVGHSWSNLDEASSLIFVIACHVYSQLFYNIIMLTCPRTSWRASKERSRKFCTSMYGVWLTLDLEYISWLWYPAQIGLEPLLKLRSISAVYSTNECKSWILYVMINGLVLAEFDTILVAYRLVVVYSSSGSIIPTPPLTSLNFAMFSARQKKALHLR